MHTCICATFILPRRKKLLACSFFTATDTVPAALQRLLWILSIARGSRCRHDHAPLEAQWFAPGHTDRTRGGLGFEISIWQRQQVVAATFCASHCHRLVSRRKRSHSGGVTLRLSFSVWKVYVRQCFLTSGGYCSSRWAELGSYSEVELG